MKDHLNVLVIDPDRHRHLLYKDHMVLFRSPRALVHVDAVSDVVSALERLAKGPDPGASYDLVVVGYDGPDLDGVEIAKKVKHLRDVPLYLATSRPEDALVHARREGLSVDVVAIPDWERLRDITEEHFARVTGVPRDAVMTEAKYR